MKTLSILSTLALCALASGQQQYDRPERSPLPAGSISFDEVHYDAPGDGQLWARGKTYKASFGSGGATYIPFLGSDAPHNMPVHFRLAEASIDGQPILLEERAIWSRDGDRVVLDRGEVDVHYLMGTESMEQTFVFERAPRMGDLDVRVAVESELELESAIEGFRFRGERGGVNYGSATVVDASGRSLALTSKLEAGAISIRVPQSFLLDASWPVVVDPLITTYTLTAPNDLARNGDICFDASSQHYYQVYSHIFSADDWDIYGAVIGLDGVPRPQLGRWVDMTADVWYLASVANSNEADNCLVVAVAEKNDKNEIWGRLRDLPGTSQGGQFQISAPSEHDYSNPSVGGDPNTDTFNRYFVAYSHNVAQSEKHILGQSVRTTGTLVGGAQAIDTEPNAYNRMPHVSKSCGTGATNERRWNVVWAREDGNDWDVRGAQMNSYGFLTTPAFSVDNTAEAFWYPQASPPLDSPSGGPRDFLVVYGAHSNGESYIKARLFKDDVYQASFDVNALEAVIAGDDFLARSQAWPTIGTDGSQFVIGYTETAVDGTHDIYACTLRHHATTLIATEGHVVIADNEYDFVLPNLATQHDAGATNSRDVGFDFRNQEPQMFETVAGAIYQTPDKWGALGQTLCDGQTNATGNAATMRVFGSPDPADNQLVLDVNGLPAFSFGQFIMSDTTQNFPLDNGVLCLGQPLRRIGASLGSSWLHGSVGHELDLENLPGSTVLQGGQTWYFQYWYRDAGSSNFSNAEAVTFE
ncbi:MAG: hypothetical protein ACI9F9_001021 [Candidatus Paceibacteria bacterium]|jgi:hypothetical protein